MDQLNPLLDQARTIWEGEIDFHGQYLVETLSTVLLTVTGVLAFLAGFLAENIHHTLYVGLGGTAVTFLVCLPPWPWYNRNPLKFLPGKSGGSGGPGAGAFGEGGIVVDGVRVG